MAVRRRWPAGGGRCSRVLAGRGAAPDVDDEAIDPLVVGQLGERAGLEGGVELSVELQPPGLDLRPGDLAAFDGEELVAVLADVDGDLPVVQDTDAGQE